MSRVLSKEAIVTNRYASNHTAIDVVGVGMTLANVISHSDGVVTEVVSNCNENTSGDSRYGSTRKAVIYGNYVKIKHDNMYTLYAHLKYGSVAVKVGDRVTKGQVIGYMGNTGYSFGAHVHFEVRNSNNVCIDPTNYLNADLPESPKTFINYTVVPGDTLDKIANVYGTTASYLGSLNGIVDINRIYIGQVIKIPVNSSYTVAKGDTLINIGIKLNKDWKRIYEDNKHIIGNNPNIIKVGQVYRIY